MACNFATSIPFKPATMVRKIAWLVLILAAPLAMAQQPAKQRAIGAPPLEHLTVEITTHLGDQQIFRAGDELTFLVNLNKQAYLTIIFQDAAGTLMQLLPNRQVTNTLYEPGWYFAIPDARDPFLYRVAAPYGDEYVYAYASNKPLPELAGVEMNGGLRRLADSAAGIEAKFAEFARVAGAELSRYRTRLVTTP